MELRQRAHVHVLLHLEVLIVDLHAGTVGRLRARVGRTFGKICRILIGRLARGRLTRRRRLHDCIVLYESLELLKVQSFVVNVVKVGSTCERPISRVDTITRKRRKSYQSES